MGPVVGRTESGRQEQPASPGAQCGRVQQAWEFPGSPGLHAALWGGGLSHSLPLPQGCFPASLRRGLGPAGQGQSPFVSPPRCPTGPWNQRPQSVEARTGRSPKLRLGINREMTKLLSPTHQSWAGGGAVAWGGRPQLPVWEFS